MFFLKKILEYKDDNQLIQKDTSVVIQRVPSNRPGTGVLQYSQQNQLYFFIIKILTFSKKKKTKFIFILYRDTSDMETMVLPFFKYLFQIFFHQQ